MKCLFSSRLLAYDDAIFLLECQVIHWIIYFCSINEWNMKYEFVSGVGDILSDQTVFFDIIIL